MKLDIQKYIQTETEDLDIQIMSITRPGTIRGVTIRYVSRYTCRDTGKRYNTIHFLKIIQERNPKAEFFSNG